MTPSSPSNHGHPGKIRQMFGDVAPRYDLLNRIMSFGRDCFWRRCLTDRLLVLNSPGRFLDLATGTGDQLVCIKNRWPDAEISGLDFSEPMLQEARNKMVRLRRKGKFQPPEPLFVCGDALEPNLPENHFDSVSISFGLRNIPRREKLYETVWRLLKPGGRFLILELHFDPRSIWAPLHKFYLQSFIPFMAAGIFGSSQNAYRYLGESIMKFPHPDRLLDDLKKAGFVDLGRHQYTFGAAMLAWGHKPQPS
ncbi:MAG: ubiquinone/menaquinone biosynthesis methyltransferase [Deltaproteobacteria bacterium]|jgi:demethylmenaquinone methyltransferase/2-methoxy-6-polyprenyl-1,4-benzoquinol methylase|nr:ubiquinone/menaquinone biosynthesis methyltransferase [Deltaproteobacteria bacterium]